MSMIKRKVILSSALMIFVLAGCSNGVETTNSSESSVQSEQQVITESSTQAYRNTVKNFTTVTTQEITDKINNGDAFYLYIEKKHVLIVKNLYQSFKKLPPFLNLHLRIQISMQNQKIYYLDLTNVDDPSDEEDQKTMEFTNEYGIDTVPAFQYFEGQIYHSEIKDIDSGEITVDEIKEFINFPYYDEDVTTAPDTTIDENE